MSRTEGHRITCRKRNCWSCGKGVWRRQERSQWRRKDKAVVAEQLAD